MQPNNKIEEIKKLLKATNLQDKPGSIIYSADSTLKKGDFYFLGQNPGGNDEKKYGEDSIMNQLLYSGEHNEYTEGEWAGAKGKIHQYNIKRMFEDLGINIEDVFSTNLCFIRSQDTDKYKRDLDSDIDRFWPIHEYLLSVVKPKTVICNGAKAREYFKKKMKHIYAHDKEPMENYWYYKHTAESFKGILKTRDIALDELKILAIPHLSNITNNYDDYFDYYKKGVTWLKTKL